MNEYSRLKENIESRASTLKETIDLLADKELAGANSVDRWTAQLALVEGALHEQRLRLAVVGSVKSGKSTLINALIGTDLLKRGAGIITAFVTRILCDNDAGGWVELKPWSQVSEELNAAVRLLPIVDEDVSQLESLDLRREKDRDRLRGWLQTTQREWQQTQGRLDPNFILLNAYLDGYERLHDRLGEQVNRLVFDARSLDRHQQFVGRETQAVYVHDMQIHYPVNWLGKEVEIADCQGSDSPNPMHLALVQQYLLKSHFILYVVSSRTGLRDADFKLLDFIKTLRMFPQTFFVLNLDLDSHADGDDLQEGVQRVKRELGWVVPNPQLFSFSALYHLLQHTRDKADERDLSRLRFWSREPAIAQLTEQQFTALKDQLAHRINHQRARILLGTGLSRLAMVANSILDHSRTQASFLSGDLGDLKKTVKHLKTRQHALQATLDTLDNAISGLKDTIKKDLNDAVHEYFDLKTGPVIRDTLNTVETYPIDQKYLQNLHDPRYLVRQLHQFYLEFRHDLSRYLVEKVNLQVIEFAKNQEALLKERLQQSSRAFWSLFQTAMEEYRNELARYRIELRSLESEPYSSWDLYDQVTPPPFSGLTEHALGRTLLLVKFSIGRLSRFLVQVKSRLGKHPPAERVSERDETMREAVQLVKSETKNELIYAFRDYRQNFKYQYLFSLLEQGTTRLVEEFRARAEMTQLDFVNLLEHSALEEERRQEAARTWTRIAATMDRLVSELEELRCALTFDWTAPPAEDASVGEAEQSPGDGNRPPDVPG